MNTTMANTTMATLSSANVIFRVPIGGSSRTSATTASSETNNAGFAADRCGQHHRNDEQQSQGGMTSGSVDDRAADQRDQSDRRSPNQGRGQRSAFLARPPTARISPSPALSRREHARQTS